MSKSRHNVSLSVAMPDRPERVFCYMCERIIVKFDSPEEERMFSETGLCGKCQKQLKKELAK
jgi:hypothetical protein